MLELAAGLVYKRTMWRAYKRVARQLPEPAERP
jgi:hypothetical protein